MIRKTTDNDYEVDTYESWDEADRFVKMRQSERNTMPVGAYLSSNRGFHKTVASRKVSQRISRARGGKHRRRLKQCVVTTPQTVKRITRETP